jgi:L-ascorbate metabolism protein UlaG (beta-lactamase superfamily)
MKASEPLRHAAIRYLGQVGFSIQVAGLTVVIDPYLTDSVDKLDAFPPGFCVRNYPPPVLPGDMNDVALVLCTHDHLDHTDPETLRGIMAASPHCHFAGPRLAVKVMTDAGIPPERTTILKVGAPYIFGDITIDSVAGAHEEYETDAEGYDRFLGYILHWGDLHLYHAGDTVLTPLLLNTLKNHRLHLAFLPVNGRSAGRRQLDILGNMDAAEAMLLAHCLAAGQGLDLVVPTHYDLYSFNGAKLSQVAEAWEMTHLPKPKFKAFLPGEVIHYAF